LSFFAPFPKHLARPEKTSVQAKKEELLGITMTPEEFEKGG
jgi:hypothetical protein